MVRGGAGLAATDPTAATAAAIAQAVDPAQLEALIAAASGRGSSEPDALSEPTDQLQHALNVDKGVASALLRILDGLNVPAQRQIDDLAESVTFYHSIMRDLTTMRSDDTDAQQLIGQAKAAMSAGLFDDAQSVIEQLESREAALDGEQHRLAAARARTLIGKLALMNLEYDKATDAFELARQRIVAAVSGPATPANTPAVHIESAPTAPVMASAALPAQPLVTVVVRPAGIVVPGKPLSEGTRDLPAAMKQRMLKRGDAMFALGDLTAARLLYERAAEAGDARGATSAAMTYDPWVLSQIGARGIQPDPKAAATWYRRALELGDAAAAVGLKRLAQADD